MKLDFLLALVPLLLHRFQVILAHISHGTEKCLLGFRQDMVHVLQADKLQSAEEVGDLKQPIVGGDHLSELRLREQNRKDRCQQFIQLDLSVIVVNDDLIKPGKEGVFLADKR